MRIRKLLICLSAVIIGLPVPLGSGFVHTFDAGGTSNSRDAFSDSLLASKDGLLRHTGFFEKSSSAARLSLYGRPDTFYHRPPANRASAPLTGQFRTGRVDYKRASVLGTANAAALFFGFKGALEAWGESRGSFHFKDDWNGDNLKQTDELSHFMWGYRMTQFLFSAYRWSGFSTRASHAISVFQTALVLTMVEYPIDAHNPEQGFGLSDLAFDYAGIGLAYLKRRCRALDDFDFKISWKRNVFFSNQPMFAQTYDEFDNFIYWFTYRTRLFLPQKVICLGLGYSATRREGVARRQLFVGVGLSLPDLAGLFGEKLRARAGFLGLFYPSLRIEL